MSAIDFNQDFFSLFQLPERYDVDLEQLQCRYRELLREVHPDRFAAATDGERRLAMQFSTRINEALETLKSPVSRAHYLLSLRDINIDPQQTIANDPAFLMHQMSLREQLMDLRGESDPESALDDLTSELEDLISHQCAAFKASYARQDYEEAKVEVAKMQFLFKLEEEVEHVEAEILDY
jgi:molecular chaperone HscB